MSQNKSRVNEDATYPARKLGHLYELVLDAKTRINGSHLNFITVLPVQDYLFLS